MKCDLLSKNGQCVKGIFCAFSHADGECEKILLQIAEMLDLEILTNLQLVVKCKSYLELAFSFVILSWFMCW